MKSKFKFNKTVWAITPSIVVELNDKVACFAFLCFSFLIGNKEEIDNYD